MDSKFIDWLKEDLNEVRKDIKSIEEKVDTLLEFKWKIVGGTILASLVLTFVFQIIFAFIQR